MNPADDSSAPPRPTRLAKLFVESMVREGDTVIDATAGNGHDTAFLAACVGRSGRVHAFDLQEAAIRSASARITALGCEKQVTFHHTSHSTMALHVEPESVSAIMFNLGFLPGEDHGMTTLAAETLAAIDAAAPLVKRGGVLTIVCYPGHPEGAEEAIAVEVKMSSMAGKEWRVAKYAMLGTLKKAPFLLLACKL